jgi:hypothetical protein
MISVLNLCKSTALAAVMVGLAGYASVFPAEAAVLPNYPHPNIENPDTYVFKAPETGTLYGYFAGSDAGYTSTLGVLVNGAETISGVFNNHNTVYGASLALANVVKGDVLTFFIDNSYRFYSDPSMNPDKFNHVYSASFGGDGTVPAGTYVGFEDYYGGGDKDYNDLNFVFNEQVLGGGTVPLSGVPLPAAFPMFGAAVLGLGAFGYARQRRRRAVQA